MFGTTALKPSIREIVITVILAILFFLTIRTLVHNFEVRGSSMEPSLQDGQCIVVSKVAYWFDDPQRGDIVIFHTSRVSHSIIHRIVGLPGETVAVKQGQLYINGIQQIEPYTQGHATEVAQQEIPYGSYFIIGDNRNATSWDAVPKGDIVGKAWLSYWPTSQWGLAPNKSWNPMAQ